jgi:hypothetical protein
MAIFEWICQECNIYWERDLPVGKAPDRTRCPKCKKLSERYYANQNLQHSWGEDRDFHTVRQRFKKHAEKGWDKTAADRWLDGSIQASKDAMNDERFRYKPAKFNFEKLAEDGHVKRLSDKESAEKRERAGKLTQQAYDEANKKGYKDIGSTKLDITKPQKQQ